ncbi:unnamed protein product [Camellia sinensis]
MQTQSWTMAGVLGTSSTALFASRPSSSHSSKCPIHSLSPTPGQSYGRKFYGGIVIPVKRERSQFRVSITNVAKKKSVLPNNSKKIVIKLELCLLLNVIDPKIGGVMTMGDRGTGKSTTVRSLVDLLPEIKVVVGDPFNSDQEDPESMGMEVQERVVRGEEVPVVNTKINMVDFPLDATEDRVCGTIDIEKALTEGVKA